jgi:hypothetical protein
MARADRRRAQRTRPAPAPRRSDVVIEDTMFFPRLRRHAKWMFLFLALVFALGFVGFGVGRENRLRDALPVAERLHDAKRACRQPEGRAGIPDLSTPSEPLVTRTARSSAQNYASRDTRDVLRELAACTCPRRSRAAARSLRAAPTTSRPARSGHDLQIGGSRSATRSERGDTRYDWQISPRQPEAEQRRRNAGGTTGSPIQPRTRRPAELAQPPGNRRRRDDSPRTRRSSSSPAPDAPRSGGSSSR